MLAGASCGINISQVAPRPFFLLTNRSWMEVFKRPQNNKYLSVSPGSSPVGSSLCTLSNTCSPDILSCPPPNGFLVSSAEPSVQLHQVGQPPRRRHLRRHTEQKKMSRTFQDEVLEQNKSVWAWICPHQQQTIDRRSSQTHRENHAPGLCLNGKIWPENIPQHDFYRCLKICQMYQFDIQIVVENNKCDCFSFVLLWKRLRSTQTGKRRKIHLVPLKNRSTTWSWTTKNL